MKRRVARHVNRVQNRAAEFERLFIEALCNAGVQAVSDFKIKTKNCKFDDLAGHRLVEIIAFREGLHRVFFR